MIEWILRFCNLTGQNWGNILTFSVLSRENAPLPITKFDLRNPGGVKKSFDNNASARTNPRLPPPRYKCLRCKVKRLLDPFRNSANYECSLREDYFWRYRWEEYISFLKWENIRQNVVIKTCLIINAAHRGVFSLVDLRCIQCRVADMTLEFGCT